MKKDKEFSISATSSKEFENCSLKYYYNRILKIPQGTNQGAICGSVFHDTMECLFSSRRREKLKKITAEMKFDNFPEVDQLIKRLMKKHEALPENYDLICNFFWTGIKLDVVSRGGQILGIEEEVLMDNENPKYRVKGYIDLLILYNDAIECLDWKSQKNMFSDAEMEHNMQGMIYCLSQAKKFPDLKVRTNFILLRHNDSQVCEPSRQDLVKFELELAELYRKMSGFTDGNRFDKVAAKQPWPSDGSFGGPLLCGLKVNYKGELKKDGITPKYHCPYRFDVSYFKLCNADGEILKTAFTEGELKKFVKEDNFIIPAKFGGCENFHKKK